MPLPNLPASRRGLLTVLAVTTFSALAAACGGGSSAASKATTTAPTTTSTVVNRAAFRQCMASHGITIAAQPPRTTAPAGSATTTSRPAGGPGGGGGGGGGAGRFLQPPPGVDPAKYQVALSACRSLLPTGGGAGNGQFRTAYIAYVTCLRNHGVTTGDPTLAQQALTNVDRTSPAFLAAAKACVALLPQRPGASGSSTTTSVPGA